MKPSRDYRKQLEAFGEAEFVTIPKADFAECIESLESMEKVNIALNNKNKELNSEIFMLNARVGEVEIAALKMCHERDALAEIHKQVIMEVFNAKVRDAKDSQTQSPSPPISKS